MWIKLLMFFLYPNIFNLIAMHFSQCGILNRMKYFLISYYFSFYYFITFCACASPFFWDSVHRDPPSEFVVTSSVDDLEKVLFQNVPITVNHCNLLLCFFIMVFCTMCARCVHQLPWTLLTLFRGRRLV